MRSAERASRRRKRQLDIVCFGFRSALPHFQMEFAVAAVSLLTTITACCHCDDKRSDDGLLHAKRQRDFHIVKIDKIDIVRKQLGFL
jgi:tetraacyldisaccharide-1-P 4'-kinase